MLKKIIILILYLNIAFVGNIYAINVSDIADELDLESIINTLEEYVPDEIQLDDVSDELISGNGIDYGKIGNYILKMLFYEIRLGIKNASSILIVVMIMAIVEGIELEKDNAISKVTGLVGFLVIVTIILKSYFIVLELFTETVMTLTKIMEIIAPFMLSLLITTGEVVTSGIVGPLLLFVTSLIGIIVSYIISPLLTISLVFSMVSNMSQTVKLNKISNLFSSTAMWIVGVIFTVFLAIMELEGSVTTSIDDVTLKATQAAVSNVVPVVGKFVSDSMEIVMGASQIIGKTIGVIGIVILIIISLIPIIKLLIYSIIYFIISAISELLNVDKNIINLCDEISKQYKTMLGIMVGIMITFVIGIGIVINLMGKVAS